MNETATAERTEPRQRAPQAAQARRLEPYAIPVPDLLAEEIDGVVELVAARLGEPPEAARRVVEVALLQRGIEALKSAEGKR